MRLSSPASLLLAGCAVALVACGTSETTTDTTSLAPLEGPRPNILFIYSDDHSAAAVSAYGSVLPATPNIDRLADQGVRFDNAFCTNAICGPARAVVLTGKHSHINGFIDNENSVFDGDQQTFPKLLQAAGYETAIIGKWHLHSDPQGFDYWDILPGQGRYYSPEFINKDGKYSLPGYNTDIVADKAIDWLSNRPAQDKPFMLMCQFKAPHRAWQASPQEVGLFDDMSMPEPSTLFDGGDNLASAAREQKMSISKDMWLYYDLKVPPLEGEELTGPDRWAVGREKHMTTEEHAAWQAAYVPRNEAFRAANLEGDDLVRWKYQRYIKDYMRCIQGIDRNVGRILDSLEASGMADNTIVIYTSDQGFFLGEHGWYDKRFMYEPSLKVPLLVRWPEVIAAGESRDALVQNLDFAPTFLEIAGAEIPDDLQGESLLSILRGQQAPQWRKGIYYEYSGERTHNVAAHYGIRTDRWKLIHYPRTDEWELLDLVNDPEEINNLYADPEYASMVATLSSQLRELRIQYQVEPRAELSMPSIFSDGMVLQRNSEVAVWGSAEPNSTVTITTDWGVEGEAEVSADGSWATTISTGDAGGPHGFTVAEADNTISCADVLFGEVWLCGGQSNMEWTLGPKVGPGIDDWKEELNDADFADIRLFDVPHQISATPRDDVTATWRSATRDTASSFSAIGFLYGRRLHAELDVPIGLISCNWGGTVAEAWMSEEALRAFGGFDKELDRLRDDDQSQSIAKRQAAWWDSLGGPDPELSLSPAMAILPGAWAGKLANFDGVVWYHREVEVPAHWAGKELTLELGPIDDNDTTWFGDVVVGKSHAGGLWNTPRSYAVPANAVKAGKTAISIRVVDTGGAGGLTGSDKQMRLLLNGSAESIPLSGQWRTLTGKSMKDLGAIPRGGWPHQNVPSVLNNGMLSPVLPYAIRGAIWYQGESNANRAKQYRTLFPAMIKDWRQRWGIGDFPFYFVQIAPFNYGGGREGGALRDAQRRALTTSNTGMAITMDIGNPGNIHPGNKQDVADRLARWALAGTYERDIDAVCGPLFKGCDAVDGNALRVSFEFAAGLTTSDGQPPSHLELLDSNGDWIAADGTITDGKLVVSSPNVTKPRAVRYGWASAAEPNLVNGAGLPASTFTSE